MRGEGSLGLRHAVGEGELELRHEELLDVWPADIVGLLDLDHTENLDTMSKMGMNQ